MPTPPSTPINGQPRRIETETYFTISEPFLANTDLDALVVLAGKLVLHSISVRIKDPLIKARVVEYLDSTRLVARG